MAFAASRSSELIAKDFGDVHSREFSSSRSLFYRAASLTGSEKAASTASEETKSHSDLYAGRPPEFRVHYRMLCRALVQILKANL